ncbi:MAG: sugar phosphate isomerase/epimerase family protein [Candidatus Helarchaeota archaeon]
MEKRILLGMDRGVWKYSVKEICEKCHQAGLDGLEIQPEHPEIFQNFPDPGGLKTILKEYDFKYNSIHAPMKDINISSYNPRIRRASLLELKNTIQFASKLSDKIQYVVMHGGQNSFRSTSQFQKKFLQKAISFTIEAIKEIHKECEEYGVRYLSVENMTYSPWRLSSKIIFLDQIFEQIPSLRFTYDYHHGIFGSERYTFRILKKYLDRLISVHIGNLYEIRKINRIINQKHPFIILEPHHMRGTDIFKAVIIATRQIRLL